MTALPKLAFSATLRPLEWANSTVIADDLSHAVPNLKRQDGEPLRMTGSPPGFAACCDSAWSTACA